MEAIFPISALQKDAASVRQEAERDLVRLTVDGRGKYVFATEDVLEDYVQRRIEDALFEQRLIEQLERSMEDVEAGREYPMEESFARIREKRAFRAAS